MIRICAVLEASGFRFVPQPEKWVRMRRLDATSRIGEFPGILAGEMVLDLAAPPEQVKSREKRGHRQTQKYEIPIHDECLRRPTKDPRFRVFVTWNKPPGANILPHPPVNLSK